MVAQSTLPLFSGGFWIEQEGVSRIVKVFWWCIEPFSPKMDIKFRSIMLPLMAGWMLGFISLMGIPFQDTVKSISWTLAIFLLISIFFWLMTFIGSFVVSMAILLQWEDVNFKAIVLLVIPLIAGFGYGIAACLCRAMTYNVHGVNVRSWVEVKILLFMSCN
ncbi:hypothetical protein TSUD_389750 [Trifolium subterraneum]|uniref:Uncharacterized protein n=1 Tax=Trifolium subterraneum TaxID=3900 RepID=A0A2Z6NW02_TRISU|nr:hypothetical protein TSUD_389750 [Trifolium subterraneum]